MFNQESATKQASSFVMPYLGLVVMVEGLGQRGYMELYRVI